MKVDKQTKIYRKMQNMLSKNAIDLNMYQFFIG